MYRYPGIKPFQFEESNLFFGRAEDTERLTKLISLEKLVVLYSKSGYGKSSLINAGLLPALAKTGGTKYFNVRFGAYSPDNNNLMDKFRAFLFLVGKKSYLNTIIPQENSLWYFLKKYQESATFRSRSRYLIVFDQFEELFTFPQEQQDEFKKQLAEALYAQIPQNFRTVVEQKLKQDRNFLTADEREDLYRPLELHILFSIRSDRMSLLNQVKDFIPQILQTCYELQALSRTQAEDAILIPAGYSKKDISFDSPPFDYSDAALNAMLNYLTDGNKKNIESFQLQIICQYIESLSVEQQISEIQPQHLGDIHDIFNNYYENSIAKLSSTADQQAAHLFIEEKLIVDERRISLDKALCLKSVTEPVLQSLADSRILRSEPNTTGGTSYEISHDTLVAPILLSLNLRKEKELKEIEIKEIATKRIKQLQEKINNNIVDFTYSTEKIKNRFISTVICFLCFIILTISALFGYPSIGALAMITFLIFISLFVSLIFLGSKLYKFLIHIKETTFELSIHERERKP